MTERCWWCGDDPDYVAYHDEVWGRPMHGERELFEMLTLESSVNAAWRTSMEIGVRVTAENVRSGEKRHTNTAYLTMVALDDQGRPTEVPPLSCASDDERRREGEAQLLSLIHI